MSPGGYIDNVLMTGDRFLAALCGWSGQYTVSAECGASRCRFCKVIRCLLGVEHCVKAALDEGRLKK
jgi:hypothetical protein